MDLYGALKCITLLVQTSEAVIKRYSSKDNLQNLYYAGLRFILLR